MEIRNINIFSLETASGEHRNKKKALKLEYDKIEFRKMLQIFHLILFK